MNNEEKQEARILIVDDNPTNLLVLFDYLNKMGFKVFVAQNGTNALEDVAANPPDLILLDVLMPGIDGFETCRCLKKDEALKDIPVIFMTALSGKEDMVKGFQVGGVDYITKPFQREEVVARIHTHLTLQRQRKALAELNAMKDRFFSIIAHDMRTALVPLIGLSDLLSQEMAKKSRIRTVASKMDGYVKHAYRLLENLLSWTSLQIGATEFHPNMIDLYNIALENSGLLRGYARKKQLHLSHSIPQKTLVYADEKMMNTVFRNLMANGIIFTAGHGAVTLSVNVLERLTEVIVSDTGVGIHEENIKKLFRIDQKFSTPGTDGEHGSGLGLILCKDLIERNGGTIRIESQPEKGTTVIFTVPRFPSQE